MTQKKEILFAIDTIEDMSNNSLVHPYFRFLAKLIHNGHQLSFFRHGTDETFKTIINYEELSNFKKSIVSFAKQEQ
ncbi:hypothetical protein [Saccharicrinis aurantiacus]|uniref:hypothetical protein n=1 Tax=Saccharicrinis aurantiacus TaxID=1849719 RepID=UPI00094FE4B7|nr:hypothetical protein [Saccharicrinis aurantiacus]